MKARVDYDHVASGYGERFQHSPLAGVGEALAELARAVRARRILDVGCGTGGPTRSLAGAGRRLLGLDASVEMLREGRRGGGELAWVAGRAETVPFRAGAFGLVTCVNALHHFHDAAACLEEAWRVLRPGGAVAVVLMDPWEARGHWFIYQYFPETWAMDLERYPRPGDLLARLRGLGFDRCEAPVVEVIEDRRVGREIEDYYFLRKDSCSHLILLSEEAYQQGRRRIRVAIAEGESRGAPAVFETRLVMRMPMGHKPD